MCHSRDAINACMSGTLDEVFVHNCNVVSLCQLCIHDKMCYGLTVPREPQCLYTSLCIVTFCVSMSVYSYMWWVTPSNTSVKQGRNRSVVQKGGQCHSPPPQIKPWFFTDVSTECFSHHMVESLKHSVALTAYINSGTSHSIIFWYHTVLMIQVGPSSLQCKTYMHVYIRGFCLLLHRVMGLPESTGEFF